MEEIHDAAGLPRLARFFDLIALLAGARERRPLASSGYKPHLDAAASSLMDDTIGLILRTLPGEVRMEDMVARAGMSPTAFSRFFKRNSGHNYVDYLRKLRIGQACRLLMQADAPITDICFEAMRGSATNCSTEKSFTHSRRRRPRSKAGAATTTG